MRDKKSVWRKVSDALWEEFKHAIGYPENLSRAIRTGLLFPVALQRAPDTFWVRSVVSWQTWMTLSWNGHPYSLHYLQPDFDRRLSGDDVLVPELTQLVKEEVVEDFSCDITDVRGISASKSEDYDIGDIDEFPMIRCPSFVEPVTAEHLEENMRWREIRLHSMYFNDYTWEPRRLYWCNSGGSHHFGAARNQAVRLKRSVTLTGKLRRYSINTPMISRLRQQWHLFLIPEQEVFGHFYHAMDAFMCPFGHSALPRNLHFPLMMKRI